MEKELLDLAAFDYKTDIRMDRNQLDIEWLEQPSLYMRYAEACIESMFERDRLADLIDVTAAEVEAEVRTNPESYGIEKITEAAVKSAVVLEPRVIEAKENYNKAKKEAALLTAAERAIDRRKASLERLTDLYIAGYWSTPRITEDKKEVVSKERKEEMVSGVKARMAERTKKLSTTRK